MLDLTGKCFHSMVEEEDGCMVVCWQGEVLGQPVAGTYLVQLYDWIVGAPSDQVMVPVGDMANWIFYESLEDMNYGYESKSYRLERRRHRTGPGPEHEADDPEDAEDVTHGPR